MDVEKLSREMAKGVYETLDQNERVLAAAAIIDNKVLFSIRAALGTILEGGPIDDFSEVIAVQICRLAKSPPAWGRGLKPTQLADDPELMERRPPRGGVD